MLFFGAFFLGAVLVVVALIGVIAQLIAIAKVNDHLARKAGKGGLIIQRVVQRLERASGLILDIAAPQLHCVGGTGGHVTPRRQMAHQIACRRRQRHVRGLLGLIIALAQGVVFDLRVDITRSAGHVAGTYGFAAGGFHRFIKIAGHVTSGHVFRVGLAVVIAPVQRQRVSGAAGQQDFLAGHAAADLWQAHGIPAQPRRINGIADRKIRIVRHDLGRFGQSLFERVGGVI